MENLANPNILNAITLFTLGVVFIFTGLTTLFSLRKLFTLLELEDATDERLKDSISPVVALVGMPTKSIYAAVLLSLFVGNVELLYKHSLATGPELYLTAGSLIVFVLLITIIKAYAIWKLERSLLPKQIN